MTEYVEIRLRLPVVENVNQSDDPGDPHTLSCRRCQRKLDDGERAYGFDRYWPCEACKDKLPAELVTRSAWTLIADHVSEHPSRQPAATVRAVLQNMAAIARGHWR